MMEYLNELKVASQKVKTSLEEVRLINKKTSFIYMKSNFIKLYLKCVLLFLIALAIANNVWAQSLLVNKINRFGGSASDRINGMIVDQSGNIYITGSTKSTGLATPGAYQQSFAGGGITGGDAFIAKIDGTTLNPIWVTYLGGSNSENGTDESGGLAFGPNESIVVIGTTASRDFPTTANALKNANTGEGEDLFISIISSDGRQLIYSSYLGGSKGELATAFGKDSNGELYIAGKTYSTDFPITSNGFQKTNPGGLYSGFLVRITNDGTTIKYGTYLGGSGSDKPKTIYIKSSDEVWIGGSSGSSNFPVTADAFDSTLSGCGVSDCDAFLLNMNTNSGFIVYSTLLGGINGDEISEIVRASSDEIYLIGTTNSPEFPITNWAVKTKNNDLRTNDGFILKFNTTCNLIVYSSLLGGNRAGENLFSCAIVQGDLLLVGNTFSRDFPTAGNSLQTAMAGGLCDAFIVRISKNGRQMLYSSYLGGTDVDDTKFIIPHPAPILIGSDQTFFIAGETASPKIHPNDPGSKGLRDIFITRWTGISSTHPVNTK